MNNITLNFYKKGQYSEKTLNYNETIVNKSL